MRTTTPALLALLLVTPVVAGCGGSSDPEPRTARAADSPRAGAPIEDRATEDRERASARIEAGDARPARVEDLRLAVSAPTPTGLVAPEHAGEFPVYLDVENQSATAVLLDDAQVRVRVSKDRETPAPCQEPAVGAIRMVDETDIVLEPGETQRFETSLPCGLTDLGTYDLGVTMILAGDGEDMGVVSATDAAIAGGTQIQVTETDPPFRYHRPALAEVPEGDPD